MYGPLGPVRHDHLMAISTAAIRNAWVQKESDLTQPADFLPDWTPEEAAGGDDT